MPGAQGPGPLSIVIDRRTALKGIAAVVGAVAVGGAAAACGTSGTAAGGAGGGSAQSGGQLSIATGDGLGQDFFVGNSFGPQQMSTLQFAWPLFRFTPGTFEVIPALAEGYTAAPDGLTHTITLRKGLTYHDGSALTAESVVANIKAAFSPDDPLRGPGTYLMIPLFWGKPAEVVGSVTAKDDTTILFDLKQPRADIRGATAFLPILNPAVLSQKGYGTDAEALKKAGSGPFEFSRFAPNEYVEFTRRAGFFEEAKLDRLRLQLVPDASARFLALQGNSVQAAIGLTKADWDAASGNAKYRTHIGNKANNVFLGINATFSTALGSQAALRRALIMAMNRDQYVSSFWGKGLADPATQITLAPGMPGYAEDVAPIPYDPDGARKLIAGTGLGPDQLTFSVVSTAAFAAAPDLKTLLNAIAGDLAKVGVTLKVNITDVAGWLAGSKTNDMQVEPFGNSGGNSAAVAALYFANPLIPDSAGYLPQIGKAITSVDSAGQAATVKAMLKQASEQAAGLPLAYTAPSALSLTAVHDLAISAAPVDPQHRAWIER